ncbi:MAG: prolyl oligopeptidase family serine peptidase [Chloroflexi bacterium]|nr:prolyl oligopeptidase family serine peptidase [Chloroflexota bacterium]
MHTLRHKKQWFGLALLVLAVMIVSLWGYDTPPSLQAQDHWTPGDYERAFEFDGKTRTFRLHIPPGYDGMTAFPLVIGLHGGSGSARQFEDNAEINDKADDLGMIVVYPDGTGGLQTWNSGYCCGRAKAEDVDDVGFIRALIETLQGTLNLDPDRIYAMGMSNGAMMSYRLAAEASDVFAAVGPVAGSIGGQADENSSLWIIPAPSEPVSIISIHGQQDESVLYEGGVSQGKLDAGRVDLSVAESIGFWVEQNGCSSTPQTETTHAGNIIHDVYPCPAGIGVELYTVVDGDHSWPGAERMRLRANDPNQDISATDLILEFFAMHPKTS